MTNERERGMTTNQPTTPDGRKIVVHRAIWALWHEHDFCAYIDGTEEDGPYGRGATEDAAIADLLSELEDAA